MSTPEQWLPSGSDQQADKDSRDEAAEQAGVCHYHHIPLSVDYYGRDYCELCQREEAMSLQEEDDKNLPP